MLETTEDWIKYQQKWPANVKKEQAEKEKGEKKASDDEQGKDTQEHEWRRETDTKKHHGAYASGQDKGNEEESDDDNNNKKGGHDLATKYTAQELALLRALEHEKDYIAELKENHGKHASPRAPEKTRELSIDERDQFSPDNWVPRSSHLIRLTGKHPLNAEPQLDRLFQAGLITPNELHYVRNHGSVPRLLWEFHQIDIEYDNKVKTMSMDDLASFDAINIPVLLACDGNRRKELNMIRKSKGFDWGPGGVSCAYWKGPLLRDVLLWAGIPDDLGNKARHWVNLEGADELGGGKYSTCIPFGYAMNPQNDVILAYHMNDVPLPPDHGYPVRVIIPGYVGGRCVKWLRRLWISDKENDSHYHIWDNRVLPSFITEKDGPFAEALFRHPDTACNEQNLNSVIVKPAHGEVMAVSSARKGQSYRIRGFAYDGGGHEVQRVEVSLDNGSTWLYCIRRFPECLVRHGKKFWTWVHWHVDVEMSHLLRAECITVRCFNVFKNTQPRDANWNVMGMMNNCWYTVRPDITYRKDSDEPAVLFRHPTEPGTGDGGWMKPSAENTIAKVRQEAGAPQKQFTREEIEKHDRQDGCWIVVDGKVYDATSVLDWHPGGAAAILGHAGKVHQETSDEFASIHDDYAYQKLRGKLFPKITSLLEEDGSFLPSANLGLECAVGVLTEKAANFIKNNAAKAAEDEADSQGKQRIALRRHRWVPARLMSRREVSQDTRSYTFGLPGGLDALGLGTCQHVQIGVHLKDRMLIRSYTPTRPLLPSPQPRGNNAHAAPQQEADEADDSPADGNGTFELTVKTYFPDENQPGGAMSNILDCMPLGEEVELKGPTGEIVYYGNGNFVIEGKERRFQQVSLVLGGSGLTPGYSLLARILLTKGDKTQIRVVDANKSEGDILLRDKLDEFERNSNGQLRITHVLSHPGDGWKGLTGHVTGDIIKDALFSPSDTSVAFVCGPPAMIQKAALPALKGKKTLIHGAFGTVVPGLLTFGRLGVCRG